MGIWNNIVNKTEEEYLVSQGKAFIYKDFFTLVKNTYIDFIFDSLSYSKNILDVTIPTVTSVTGPLTINFYAEPTVTPATGSELTLVNRNSKYAITNPATIKIIQNPTITNIGSRFGGALVPSSGSSPSNSNSAASGTEKRYTFIPSKILIRITNTSVTTDTLAEILFIWYEID